MTKLTEVLVNQIKNNGWLSVSSFTCDNLSICNIAQSQGMVGYCEDKNIFIYQTNEDTGNTYYIGNQIATWEKDKIGFVKTINFIDADCLQWWQAAQYALEFAYSIDISNIDNISNHTFPVTKWPSEADLDACTKGDDGLYTGPKVATAMDCGGKAQVSVIPFFEDKNAFMTAAIIDGWKIWYNKHKVFKKYIKEQFNLTII